MKLPESVHHRKFIKHKKKEKGFGPKVAQLVPGQAQQRPRNVAQA
jgi:hypothetical protein